MDFNAMLRDPTLFHDLAAFYFSLNQRPSSLPASDSKACASEEYQIPENPLFSTPLVAAHIPVTRRRLLSFLIAELDNVGAFQKAKGTLPPNEERYLRTANKCLIFSVLDTVSLSFSFEDDGEILMRSKDAVKENAAEAGFELVADREFLPKYFFLEFRRAD
jgi:hypothetical protein